MGWFLSSTTKRKKTAKKPAKRERTPWSPQRTLYIITAGSWAIVLTIAVVGWPMAERRLKATIGASHDEKPEIVLQQIPVWMPANESKKMFTAVQGAIETDPFNKLCLHDAADLLSANPWVKKVEHVTRLPGGRIEVLADYRQPAAMVQVDQVLHLVDSEGVRLPMSYPLDASKKPNLPVITGIKAPPPAVGQTWQGLDVRAGLKLAAVVTVQKWAKQVQAIDVSNQGYRLRRGDPQLVLVTRDGQIRWGCAPDEERFYEPKYVQKLKNIEKVIREVEGGDLSGKVVDVSGDAILIHKTAETGDLRYTLGQ